MTDEVSEMTALESQLRELRLQLADQTIELASLRAGLTHGHPVHAAESGDPGLEQQLADATAELATFRLRVQELDDQHSFDERRLALLERARERLRDQHAAAEAAAQHAEAATKELARERTREIEALTQELATLRDEAKRQHVQIRQLRHEVAAAESRASETRSALVSEQAFREERDREVQHLRDTATAEQAQRAALTDGLEALRSERAALARHLIRTQGTLRARTEQLLGVLSSRWYRVARSSWMARRRRPPLIAIALGLLAVGGVVASAILYREIGALIAGVLGALLVAGLAVAYAIVVPALRDKRVPRLAGDGSFTEPLPAQIAAIDELVHTVAGEADEPKTDDGSTAAPEQQQADRPAVAAAPKTGVVTRLVPALLPDSDAARERWLATTRQRDLRQLRVAGVLDDMSRACFAPECRLDCDFTMADWQERLEANPPHLLLVESAWSGNSGGWQYGVASYPHPDYAGLPSLRALIDWCRAREIPTVFWNKEDPVHFERFREAAALFDHIFTTDANCIPAYESLQGPHVRTTRALQFAAQPRLHNPVAIVDRRSQQPVFAGTYYRNRHADRRASLEMILDAARPFGLIIYDRTFGTESDEYGFPDRFLPHIEGRLAYDQVVTSYKSHRVFLNVNSVIDSPTMFSRRVFELLACGTAVLSTESAGMQTLFGELVPVAESIENATAKLERLLYDDAYYADLTSRARRLVLGQHTYRHRLHEIATTAGFSLAGDGANEVAALAIADTPEELEGIERALLAQSREPEEIVLGCSNGASVADDVQPLIERFGATRVRSVTQNTATNRIERWRELAALAASPWVAPMDPNTSYRNEHLDDLVACTTFAEADVIGAAPGDADGRQHSHQFAQAVPSHAALAVRSLVAQRGWQEDPAGQRQWFEQGVRFFVGEPDPAVAAAVASVEAGDGGDGGDGRELHHRRRARRR